MERKKRFRGVSPELRSVAREMRREPTNAEKKLWLHLRDRQVSGLRFRRQHAFERFVLDFYCAEAGLAVEVDGGIHQEQRERDAARTEVLDQHAIRVIRFTNAEIFEHLPAVLQRIATTAAEPRARG